MEAHKSDQSFFNMGVAYLKRVDAILTMCSIYGSLDDPHKWIRQIRALYRELSIFRLAPEEQKEIDDSFQELYKEYNSGVTRNNKGKILLMMDHLEIRLRRIAQEKGLLLPKKDDPRFSVLKR